MAAGLGIPGRRSLAHRGPRDGGARAEQRGHGIRGLRGIHDSSPAAARPTDRLPTASSERWSALRAERIGRERTHDVAAPRRTGIVLVGAVGLGFAAGMLVLLTRWLLSTPAGVAFLTAYPGEYPLPAGAPVGLPAWLAWQHFLNAFFLVLIVRSGLQVRHQKRPSAFWSPRRDPKRKISLTLWFHQALDVLWIANGVLFPRAAVRDRSVDADRPTSWEVLPNAVSAAAQYVSLDWPTENGWLNYNALQQLAYFTIVFVAAPLAIATGVRMSGVWPRGATRLDRAYPVEWARAVHYPVMLFFVAFTVVHVGLVLATARAATSPTCTPRRTATAGSGWCCSRPRSRDRRRVARRETCRPRPDRPPVRQRRDALTAVRRR